MKSPNKLDTVTRGRSILTRHASANLSLLSLTALVLVFRAGSARAGWGLPQGGSFPVASLSSQRRLDRGKELMKQRKFAEAAAEFRELLRTEPNSPFIYNLLGLCALQQGLREEAVTYFKKAVELDPGFKPARNNLGGVYLLEGRPQDAAKEFLAVTRIDARDSQAYFNLARAELATNQETAGLQHLRQAYDLSPDSLDYAMALGRLYLKQGRKEAAKPVVEKLTNASSSNPTIELELGGLLLSYGKEEAAVEHLRRVQGVEPKAGEALYALAVDHFKKQDFKAALRLLEMVGPSMQNSAAWHDLVGESHFKLGEPGPAVAEVQKAMNLDPHDEDYVLELSEILVTNGASQAAVTLLDSAKKVFPDSSRIWFALGVAYLDVPDHPAAEAALTKSLELDPKLDLACVVLCRSYEETGKWDQLTETAHKVIRINPRNSLGYYYGALALLRSSSADAAGDEEAEKLLTRSIELDENEPEPRYELAKLMIKEGNKKAAQLELEKIIRVNPDFAPAFYQLSRLDRGQGEVHKSEEEQKTFDRLSAQERVKAMTKMLVEIHQREANR